MKCVIFALCVCVCVCVCVFVQVVSDLVNKGELPRNLQFFYTVTEFSIFCFCNFN